MGESDEALVRFAGVQKSYDRRTPIVQALDLEIRRGEFLSLFGPSGAGKTTCLMMLAGFERPSKGEIYLDGQPLRAVAPYRRDLALVFQSYALFPHMTVAENLAFPLQVRRTPRLVIRTRVEKALAMLGLERLGDRRPYQLAPDQQLRAALARALVFEPKLVLLDEPLGGLDTHHRQSLQLELRALHRQHGLTMLYATHDPDQAMSMSDRVAVLDDGRVAQLAAPQTLYDEPANARVASFVGESNCFAGRVVERIGDECQLEIHSRAVLALAVSCGGSGSAALMVIRPERLVIDPPDEQLYDNAIGARVEDVAWSGDHQRVRLNMLGRSDVYVKLQNHPGQLRVAPTQAVRVAWSARDARAHADR